MVCEADPTCVGRRHGLYVFALDGSGYDEYGGRWDDVGSCSSANFDDRECCGGYGKPPANLTTSGLPGCRYAGKYPLAGPAGGPGNPFEWSEFGATAISDVDTLKRVDDSPDHAALEPANVGEDPFWTRGVSSPGMWLSPSSWAPPFCANRSAAAAACNPASFDSIDTIVRLSQFAQAEAYRFAYQAARRVKWHHSLMASWTFDEPWPNSAHGCIVDYYGLPKHAFYWVRDAMRMVDISLSYSDLWQVAGQKLSADVWVDNELDVALPDFAFAVEYFTLDSGTAKKVPQHGGGSVAASDHVNLGRPEFVIPPALVGKVIVVRLTLWRSREDVAAGAEAALATNDYHFSVVNVSAPVAQATAVAGPLHAMLRAPRVELVVEPRNATVVAVSVRGGGDGAPAVFVKPVLLDAASGARVPHVVFSHGYFTLRPGRTVGVAMLDGGLEASTGGGGTVVFCAEAWNADRVCEKIA